MHSLYAVKSIPQTQTQFINDIERRLEGTLLDDNNRMRKVIVKNSEHESVPVA